MNSYIIHKNTDGSRAILANNEVIAICPNTHVASMLMAVLMVSEIEHPITWPSVTGAAQAPTPSVTDIDRATTLRNYSDL